jgi:radical SAM superfamily enzyme YgiQ (UPF0313 family)
VRVLLVNTNRERTPYPVIPLGACLVASALRENGGHEVRFLDLTFSADPGADLQAAVSGFAPQAAGLSVRNIDNVDYLAPIFYLEEIRERFLGPLRSLGIPLVAGGPGFSIEPEGVLRYLGLDLGVVGDGERGALALFGALERGDDPRGTPGLAWIDEGGAFHQNPRAFDEDLDGLPFSRPWTWLDARRYLGTGGSLSVQTKRGCALRCAYCVYNTIEGSRYRLRSVESIAEEMGEIARETPFREIDFTDSTFNAPLDHAKSLLRALARIPGGFRYQTSGINPGFVDEELAALLGEARFKALMITAEAASETTLAGLQKGFTPDDVARTVELVKDLPLRVFWYFLFGGPGESERTARETLDFIDRRIPRSHLVYFGTGIRIQRGAPIERVAREQGLIGADTDLLRPHYYFSPEVDRGELLGMVGREVLAHPNYIQTVDYQGGRGPVLLSRIFRLLRIRRPSWSFVPTLFRICPFLRSKDRFERKGDA